MAQSVLLVMPKKQDSETLSALFEKRGMDVYMADSLKKIDKLSSKKKTIIPDLAVIDIHLPEKTWLEALQKIRNISPETSILYVTDRSDPSLILRAKTIGAKNFLRAPYDEAGLQNALRRMQELEKATPTSIRERLPEIRTPIRVKIILPYIVMAIIIGVGVAIVVNDNVRDSSEERFINQLINSSKLSADWMVREEESMLSTLRLISNTQGMAQAILNGDTERIRELTLPIAVNNQDQAVEILNVDGIGLIGLRADIDSGEYSYASGEEQFIDLEMVQVIISDQSDLSGDKFAGLALAGNSYYFYVTGPVKDEEGNLVGVVMVGNSVESIAAQMRADTLAHISLYDQSGNLLSSTLNAGEKTKNSLPKDDANAIISGKADTSVIQSFTSSGEEYREILTAWEVRAGQDLGVIGTSHAETLFIINNQTANVKIFIFLTGAFMVVILLGLLVARRISKPLMQMVEASTEVANGNFDVRLPLRGDDEISVLAHSFNRMVVGLKDGMLYRSLLGRTVSPEVRDRLRANLASGDLQIQGQFAIATIMMVDVHSFTTLSEREDPATVMNWLNELYNELVPIITSFDGVVNEISGDSLFAFFGILPQPLEAAESSYLACQAGVEMLHAIERINWRRMERGDTHLTIGVGINTGPVTAGGLGAQDRLHYTVIGDAVNTTQRIETLAHQFEESAVMISKQTLISMWDRKNDFNVGFHGNVNVKGKLEELEVYRLWPAGVEVPAPIDLDSVGSLSR